MRKGQQPVENALQGCGHRGKAWSAPAHPPAGLGAGLLPTISISHWQMEC